MAWILLLLCLAVGGRELYTAYERRQQARQADTERARAADRLRAIEESVHELSAALAAARAETGADRARVDTLERTHEQVAAAVADLHRDQVTRLEHEIEQGTALRGVVRGDTTEHRGPLCTAYARCLTAYGLQVQAARRTVRGSAWTEVYHLSGDGLTWLPQALLGKARGREDKALRELLTTLDRTPGGLLRIGAFAAVCSPDGLLYGLTDDADDTTDRPETVADRVRALPTDQRGPII